MSQLANERAADTGGDEVVLHASPQFHTAELLGQTYDPYLKGPRDILRGVFDELMYVLHYHVMGTLIASARHKNPISFHVQNALVEMSRGSVGAEQGMVADDTGLAYNMPIISRAYGAASKTSISLSVNKNSASPAKIENWYLLDRGGDGILWKQLLAFQDSLHSHDVRSLLSHVAHLNANFVRSAYYSRRAKVSELATQLHDFCSFLNHRNFLSLRRPTGDMWKVGKLIAKKAVEFCETCLEGKHIQSVRPDLAMASQRHIEQIKRLHNVMVYMEPASVDSNRSNFRHKCTSVMDNLQRTVDALDVDLQGLGAGSGLGDDCSNISEHSRFACTFLVSRMSYWKSKKRPRSQNFSGKSGAKKTREKRKWDVREGDNSRNRIFKACSGVRHEYGALAPQQRKRYYREFVGLDDSSDGILRPVHHHIYDPTGKTHADMLNHSLDLLAVYFRELLKAGIENALASNGGASGTGQLFVIFASSPPFDVLVPKDVAGVILWGRPSTPELQRMWEPVSTFEMHQKAMKYKSVSTFEDVRNAVKAGKMSMKQGRNILEEFVQHCPLSNDPRCKFCNYRLLPFLFIY